MQVSVLQEFMSIDESTQLISPSRQALFLYEIFFSYNCICIILTQLKLFIFIERVSTIHITTWNMLIDMKMYGGKNWMVLICFWTWRINTWKFYTTTQNSFLVWWCVICWWICTHCCHWHVIFCLKHMITMWYGIILYVLNKRLGISIYLLLLFPWPTAHVVWPNYEVVMFQPRSVCLYWILELVVFTLLYVGGTYVRLVYSWYQNIFHVIAVLIVFHAANEKKYRNKKI